MGGATVYNAKREPSRKLGEVFQDICWIYWNTCNTLGTCKELQRLVGSVYFEQAKYANKGYSRLNPSLCSPLLQDI